MPGLRALPRRAVALGVALAVAVGPAGAEGPVRWVRLPVGAGAGGATLRVPLDRFRTLATIPIERSAAGAAAPADAGAVAALPGRVERWLRDQRPEIGAVATLDAAQTTALARALHAPLHVVLGRLALDRGELRIDVLRLARGRDPQGRPAVVVARAPFTPAHGRHWAAAGTYRTAAEQRDAATGHDPFALHAPPDPDDPRFVRIDLGMALVAAGHAAARHRAPLALVAVTGVRGSAVETRSGGLLRRRVTTTVRGHALTEWLVGTPAAAQPWLPPTLRCVVATPCVDAGCSARAACPEGLAAAAGFAFDRAQGGGFDRLEQLVFEHRSEQSGWGWLALGVLVGAFTYGFGTLLAGASATAGGLAIADHSGGLVFGAADPVDLRGRVLGPDRIDPAPLRDGRFDPAPAADWRLQAMVDAATARSLAEWGDPTLLGALGQGHAALAAPDAALFDPQVDARSLQAAVARWQQCVRLGAQGAALRRCVAAGDAAVPAGGGAP